MVFGNRWNTQMIEVLPLVSVLSDTLKQISQSILWHGSAGIILADECSTVMGSHSSKSDLGPDDTKSRNGHDAVCFVCRIDIQKIREQISRNWFYESRSSVRKHIRSIWGCAVSQRHIFVINDVSDDFSVFGLWVTTRNIFWRCPLADCITLRAVGSTVINNRIDRSWDCSYFCRDCHKNTPCI